MVPKNDHYIFAPDDMLKDLGKSSQIQYGWRWDNISIVVGSLSSEVGSLIDLNLRKKTQSSFARQYTNDFKK